MPLATSDYRTTPGGVGTLTTSQPSVTAPPGVVGGGGSNLDALIEEMLRRKMAATSAGPAVTAAMAQPGLGMAPSVRGTNDAGASGVADAQRRAKLMAIQQQQGATRTAMDGPPLKINPGGAGYADGSHYELDTLHMSPEQRRDYLPNGSAMSTPPSDDAGSGNLYVPGADARAGTPVSQQGDAVRQKEAMLAEYIRKYGRPGGAR